MLTKIENGRIDNNRTLKTSKGMFSRLGKERGGVVKKTRLMLRVEEQIGVPLEQQLPRLITREGLTGTAKLLGVSTATAGYWKLKFGISIRVVALGSGDYVEIKRSGKPPFVFVDELDIPVLLQWPSGAS